MLLWFDESIAFHHKRMRAAAMLKQDPLWVTGLLVSLWYWVAANAPCGRFDRETFGLVADAIGYRGRADHLLDCLVKCGREPDGYGFLELDGDEIVVHDWDRYTGAILARDSSAQATANPSEKAVKKRSVKQRKQPPVEEPTGQPSKPRSLSSKGMSAVALERFERWWNEYPKGHKRAKGAAKKAWKKYNFNDDETEMAIAALRRQRTSNQWTKENGRFIPLPSTWLNQERWEDEIDGADEGPGTEDLFANSDGIDIESARALWED